MSSSSSVGSGRGTALHREPDFGESKPSMSSYVSSSSFSSSSSSSSSSSLGMVEELRSARAKKRMSEGRKKKKGWKKRWVKEEEGENKARQGKMKPWVKCPYF